MRRRIAFIAALVFVLIAAPAIATPGHIDGSFGEHGKVTTDFTKNRPDAAHDLAIQANGRIVAVGSAIGGGGRFALIRYKVNGSLDVGFGDDGTVTTTFSGDHASAEGVAIQDDGKVVVAGVADGSFAVARYDTDGTLDDTFSDNGKVTTAFTSEGATDIAIQDDGKIVAAGNTGLGEFALARYDVNGELDGTFGDAGTVISDPTTGFDWLQAVAIQSNGSIVAAGFGLDGERFAVARYDLDGNPDAAFGGDGTVTTNLSVGSDIANDVAIQSDGAIVVAGSAGFCCEYTARFGLVRYAGDGSLDETFGGDGKVLTNFGGDGGTAYGVAIQPNGRIVAAGSSGFDGLTDRFGLARYRVTGTLDTTFHDKGWVTTGFSDGIDSAKAVAVQNDGKVVAAGVADGGGNGMFALARFLA